MELVWATDDLVIAGHSYKGFPILLWESMESCVPANLFFRYYLLRGAIGSKRSWPSTGRALYDFFSFLEAHTLDWRNVERGEEKNLVAAYRDYSLKTCNLAPNTVRQRITYVCKFYEFALKERWVDCLPFAFEERHVSRQPGVLAHIDARRGLVMANDVMPRIQSSLPRFLTMLQVKNLLAAAVNPHHRMMIRLALHTGLRREEIAAFPLAYVFNPQDDKSNVRNFLIKLDPYDGSGMVTKGSKTRSVYISRNLMSELYRYVLKVRGERAHLSKTSQRALFLNHEGNAFGEDGKSLNRIISNIGKNAGMKVHTHMLRHTYATLTLLSLQRDPLCGVDPLVFLQRQLGHTSLNTTMMYLHLVNEMADDAVLAYDDELIALGKPDDQAQDLP